MVVSPTVSPGLDGDLAHVMEQGGQPEQSVGPGLVHHGQGVGQDVLVLVNRVLLEGQAGVGKMDCDAGRDELGHAGPRHGKRGDR